MKNILILEDKEPHLEALSNIVSEVGSGIRIYRATTVSKAYQIAGEVNIHLFLIDIILQPEKQFDVLGLEFAQEIRKIHRYEFIPIIFITALEDPKLFAYSRVHCYSYIEKPFDAERVKNVVKEALKFPIQETNDRIAFFRREGIIYAKAVKDIIYVESSRRKVVIHCKEEVLEIPYMTCDDIMRELNSEAFIQCSRYVIINKNYIETIDYSNRYLKLKYISSPIEIGVVMKNKFKQRLENG